MSKPALVHEGVNSACSSPQVKLPDDAWCKILSFVLRSYCHLRVSAVSPLFHQLTEEPFSWDNAMVGVRAVELETIDGQPRFDPLIPKWRLCSRIFIDCKDAHTGKRRRATQRCFSLLTQHCLQVKGLFIRNWCLFERDGLSLFRTAFPKLQHLELSGCDYISHVNCMHIFELHPTLLSFRATFSPRALAKLEFAQKAPRTLIALGFVNLENSRVLAMLLEHCPLEHLWFSRTTSFSPEMVETIMTIPNKLKTLSLPARTRDEDICVLARTCSQLEMMCCMREGFGGEVFTTMFEPLPGTIGTGIVARRRGSCAQLAPNGSLWAPYTQSDNELWTGTI